MVFLKDTLWANMDETFWTGAPRGGRAPLSAAARAKSHFLRRTYITVEDLLVHVWNRDSLLRVKAVSLDQDSAIHFTILAHSPGSGLISQPKP